MTPSVGAYLVNVRQKYPFVHFLFVSKANADHYCFKIKTDVCVCHIDCITFYPQNWRIFSRVYWWLTSRQERPSIKWPWNNRCNFFLNDYYMKSNDLHFTLYLFVLQHFLKVFLWTQLVSKKDKPKKHHQHQTTNQNQCRIIIMLLFIALGILLCECPRECFLHWRPVWSIRPVKFTMINCAAVHPGRSYSLLMSCKSEEVAHWSTWLAVLEEANLLVFVPLLE